MSDAALLLAIFATAWFGFALLALSQPRHWRRVVGSLPLAGGRIIVMRLAGGVLILGSLILALLRDGPSFGALLWATLISLAAFTVSLTVSLRPRWLRPLTLARCRR